MSVFGDRHVPFSAIAMFRFRRSRWSEIRNPYREFIDDTLRRYPKLRATRLYDMLRERGYTGAVRTLREYVALVRPKPRREIYLGAAGLRSTVSDFDRLRAGEIAAQLRAEVLVQ